MVALAMTRLDWRPLLRYGCSRMPQHEPDILEKPLLAGRQRSLLLLSGGALGISCAITQFTLMREMLCVFAGNEMVLGIILGNWLFCMGLGAKAGNRLARQAGVVDLYIVAQVAVTVLPWFLVVAARTLRNFLFLHGAMVGATETALASAALLAPYCLTAGASLAIGSQLAGASRIYIADSLGSVLGGMLFSLLLVRWLDHFLTLLAAGLLVLVVAGAIAWQLRKSFVLGVVILFAVALSAAAIRLDLDKISTAWQYPGQTVRFAGNSPYGRLVITEAAGEHVFWENGVVLASTYDIAHAEEAAHLALMQRPKARRVLLISGGIAGCAREILKHNVEEVVYVELDPLLLETGRRFLPANFNDPRLKVAATDGRLYVKRAREKFDIIIIDLPEPVTAQLNRFFTAEFFAEARRALQPDGIISFGAGRYENYVSPRLAQMLSTTLRTAHEVFKNILILPAGRVFFLASDGPMESDVVRLVSEHPPPARYLTPSYVRAMFSADRMADIQRAASQPARLNRDMNPSLYYHHLQHWLSQFERPHLSWMVVLGAGFLVYVMRLGRVSLAIFASGFTASALELMILLAFQALCGSLYQQLGLVVAVFMAGLAAGAWAAASWNVNPEQNNIPGTFPIQSPERKLAVLAAALAAVSLMLIPGLSGISRLAGSGASLWLVQLVILAMTFVVAGVVGAEFPMAVRATGGEGAAASAKIYSADFLGASLGGWLAATWLAPTLGLANVCLLTGGINLACAALLWIIRR